MNLLINDPSCLSNSSSNDVIDEMDSKSDCSALVPVKAKKPRKYTAVMIEHRNARRRLASTLPRKIKHDPRRDYAFLLAHLFNGPDPKGMEDLLANICAPTCNMLKMFPSILLQGIPPILRVRGIKNHMQAFLDLVSFLKLIAPDICVIIEQVTFGYVPNRDKGTFSARLVAKARIVGTQIFLPPMTSAELQLLQLCAKHEIEMKSISARKLLEGNTEINGLVPTVEPDWMKYKQSLPKILDHPIPVAVTSDVFMDIDEAGFITQLEVIENTCHMSRLLSKSQIQAI